MGYGLWVMGVHSIHAHKYLYKFELEERGFACTMAGATGEL